MKAKWLYCTTDETWHLWPPAEEVVNGDEAYCGHVKDSNDIVAGESMNKCQACIDATRS